MGKCQYKMESMTTTLTLGKAGRVILPKSVRDEMQLRVGDSLELENSEGRIVLRPQRRGARLHRKQGVWVLSTGRPISAEAINKVLRDIRNERELKFLGNLAPHAAQRKKPR
jgi:AbrB family looped-hinge helix DNA binding protein